MQVSSEEPDGEESSVPDRGSDSLEHLFPLLYEELRQMAHRQLRNERSGHTLQTTALVHEAYLRLTNGGHPVPTNRSYLYGAAARAMRQILVDYARRRNAVKRGQGVRAISLDEEMSAVDGFAADLLDLDAALDRLSNLNPRYVRVVECRYFAGLTAEETAEALGVSLRTVRYDWSIARAWLHEALRG